MCHVTSYWNVTDSKLYIKCNIAKECTVLTCKNSKHVTYGYTFFE